MTNHPLKAAVVAGTLALVACTGPSAPSRVEPGSTIVVFVHGERAASLYTHTNFASTIRESSGNPDKYDRQRNSRNGADGDATVFYLVSGSEPKIRLATRYITRLYPDPASDAGLNPYLLYWGYSGEVVAALDIPLVDENNQAVAGLPRTYTLQAFKVPRNHSSQPPTYNYASKQWLADIQTVQLLPRTSTTGPPNYDYTQAGTYDPYWGWIDFTSDLINMIPNPKIVVSVGTNYPPLAAIEMTVLFQNEKYSVLSAILDGTNGFGKYVSCTGCTSTCSPTATWKTATIRYLAPAVTGGEQVVDISLPFKACGPQWKGAVNPNSTADFQLDSVVGYNASGTAIATVPTIMALTY